uniref:MHD domain-containing protein n=1 Tax=Chromulina nebulosa TaxID=96789 RepID=A0A7S0STP4_9STRA|mmetsp:Transcript_2645/g.2331  ORF Transcript_2645/g.2331 Transcript_2645/m.2331 type:complete len:432 (+) Transcript_2645:52-1347(+)
MASTIFIVNQKGDEVIARHYRFDITKSSMDTFRNKIIASKSTGQNPPVVLIEGTSFMYIKHTNIFLVAATRSNPNVTLIFEYLIQKLRILKSYLGDTFTDESIQSNFTLLYELFDETMDYGYPQTCAIDVLKLYINLGNLLQREASTSGVALTSQITGAIDWRRDGLKYRKNEVNIDVQETVTLVTSVSGQVLRAELSGKIIMKSKLSGMPECKFGLNDKLIMEKEGGAAAAAASSKASGVEIDDCTFHRCVRLGKFDSERTITFIPPDGEFELMKYRVTAPAQPFRLIPTITEESKTKVLINLKVVADFPEDKKASTVVIKFPVPPTTASAKITVGRGRAKYDAGEGAIVWKIYGFPGSSESLLAAVVDLLPATREKAWNRPPINVEFSIPMFSSSGVQVRFLKVYEKSGYQTARFVRYVSKSGEYSAKI